MQVVDIVDMDKAIRRRKPGWTIVRAPASKPRKREIEEEVLDLRPNAFLLKPRTTGGALQYKTAVTKYVLSCLPSMACLFLPSRRHACAAQYQQ